MGDALDAWPGSLQSQRSGGSSIWHSTLFPPSSGGRESSGRERAATVESLAKANIPTAPIQMAAKTSKSANPFFNSYHPQSMVVLPRSATMTLHKLSFNRSSTVAGVIAPLAANPIGPLIAVA